MTEQSWGRPSFLSEQAGWDAAAEAASAVITQLRASGLTVATAESLTGGAVCVLLTQAPGASQTVRGGVVAYATDLKSSVLEVSSHELAESGPVTRRVALAMALGARSRLGADVGLATTGEAGPESGSGAPVGTVFVAVVTPRGSWVRQLDLDGSRDEISAGSVHGVLALTLDALAGKVD